MTETVALFEKYKDKLLQSDETSVLHAGLTVEH